MKQDRFLTGILIGIAVLIVLALVLFFVRKNNETYVADTTPEGVVQNYIVAIHKGDYEKAYSYLADKEYKPTLDQFQRDFLSGNIYEQDAGIEIGSTRITGNDAYVDTVILINPGDPFSSEFRNTETAALVKQGEDWKLVQMPYAFWLYDWYQPAYQPTKP
jgi:hypothetical protein